MQTIVYNALLASAALRRWNRPGYLWARAWELANRHLSGPVSTNIYGYRALVNFGNMLPLWGREYDTYNNPLLEVVAQAYGALCRPLHVVDVGAAVGDTVLLVKRNCPRMVDRFTCIDGDEEFLMYSRRNLGRFDDVRIVEAMLSDQEGEIATLVRTHPGTASAFGSGRVHSTTLDSVMASEPRPVDVLKIDVDGFDGRVLSGARDILQTEQPYVQFEWTPAAYEQTGNDWRTPFHVLSEAGYDRFVWFTKVGSFSHYMFGYDERQVATTASYCLETTAEYDPFFDVVALGSRHEVSPVRLADLRFARRCVYRY